MSKGREHKANRKRKVFAHAKQIGSTHVKEISHAINRQATGAKK